MSDTHEVEFEEYEESWTGRIIVAAVIAVALIAGSFFVGRALAGGGPATLADAVAQAQAGELPCGETAEPAGTPAPGAEGRLPGGGAFAVRAICDPGARQRQAGGQGRARFGGLGQTGTVTAVDGDTLTLDGPTGSTTVTLDGSTTINKTAAGDRADIKPGASVIVAGTGGPNAGSAATSVTILPATGAN